MNLQKFASLEQDAQLLFLLKRGVCVADRTTESVHIFLYQVKSFYVEVYHDKINDRVMSLKIFSSTHSLDPYLQKINISGLLKKILFLPFFEILDIIDTSYLASIIG